MPRPSRPRCPRDDPLVGKLALAHSRRSLSYEAPTKGQQYEGATKRVTLGQPSDFPDPQNQPGVAKGSKAGQAEVNSSSQVGHPGCEEKFQSAFEQLRDKSRDNARSMLDLVRQMLGSPLDSLVAP